MSKVSVQPNPMALEQLQREIVSLITILRQSTLAQMSHHHSPNASGNHPTTMCWYHQRFGNYAKECQPPCSHSGNDLVSH